MPQLPPYRDGQVYKLRDRKTIDFSFWPTVEDFRPGRKAIQDRLYTNDPWSVVMGSVNNSGVDIARKEEAKNFLQQAKEYFDAANNKGIEAAKPVLNYYCALNLVKALLLTHGIHTLLDTAKHGLSEGNTRATAINNHVLRAFPTTLNDLNIFDEFYFYLYGNHLPHTTVLRIKDLMAQTVIGHRIFIQSESITEKFVQVRDIEYVNSEADNQLWLRFFIKREDLQKSRLTQINFLSLTGLSPSFRIVRNPYAHNDMICIEQIVPFTHAGWPTDALKTVSQNLRNITWKALSTTKPFTLYYLYVKSPGETTFSQLLNIYALFYYLGSVTRYRPKHFQELLNTKYSGFINEFINNQITQFLYGMAAEFAKNDVAKPSFI